LEDSNVEQAHHANENNTHPYRNFTNDERQQIYAALLEQSDRERLKRKSTTIVAQMFHVSRPQVQRIWQRAKQCRAQGQPVDVRSRKSKNCERKKMQVDLSEVLRVPLHRRSTIRSLAKAIGVKRSTLHRWFKEGLLRRHSSTLKPLLREENKKERLQWCVSMLDKRRLQNEPKFLEMENIMHMDEK
jgi:transposase-like protein